MNSNDKLALITDLRAAATLGRPLTHAEVDDIDRHLAAPTPPADKQDGDVWLSKGEAQLALWQAIRDIKIGNATDDKLILANLMRSGLWIGRMATKPAAPAPSEPAEAVGTLTVHRYRGSDAMVNYDFDLHATLPDGSYQLYLRQTEPAPAPSEPDEAVGYLDIGAGGYIDIGSDLTDAQLSAMPKGRHMLGIIGTYGVDGYTRPQTELAQAAPSAQDRR